MVTTKGKRRIVARVGSRPIHLPQGVKVEIGEGNVVTVEGPKGALVQSLHPEMNIHLAESILTVDRPSDAHRVVALHGLTRALLNNMVVGTSEGFQRSLELVGMGYRVQQGGEGIILQVGFSHPVEIAPPAGVVAVVDSPTRITVSGCDKQQVGQFAATLRKIRPPDAYKGKGVRYSGELVRLKPGKTAGRS